MAKVNFKNLDLIMERVLSETYLYPIKIKRIQYFKNTKDQADYWAMHFQLGSTWRLFIITEFMDCYFSIIEELWDFENSFYTSSDKDYWYVRESPRILDDVYRNLSLKESYRLVTSLLKRTSLNPSLFEMEVTNG